MWALLARAMLGKFQVGVLRHGPMPLARCPYCGELETINHAFGCTAGHAATLTARHNEVGEIFDDAAIKLGGWPEKDIIAEVALGQLGVEGDGAERKRPDRYMIDRDSKTVFCVEFKVSADLPRAIGEANDKYGHIAEAGRPVTIRRRHTGEPLPDIGDDYTWEPCIYVFAIGTWLAVPGEATAAMDRVGIPLHEQDRVLYKAAKAVMAHNLRIADRRWPAGFA